MANLQSSGGSFVRATIDTAPAAAGFWTEPAGIGFKNITSLYVQRTGAGTGTVTLQFKRSVDATWIDYVTTETIAIGSRYILDDSETGIAWRVGVKQGDLAGGTIIVDLGWGKA